MDVITTNSYAIVPFHIGDERFDKDAQLLAERAGQLAKKCRKPYGAWQSCRVYSAPFLVGIALICLKKNQVQRLATPLINGLKNHADIWLLETQSSIIEPTELIARLPHDRRIWLSFTLDDTATSTGTPCLRSGKSVQYATSAMLALDAPVDAILFNCSQPEVIDTALLITAQTLANTAKKFAFRAYANAFKPQDETGSANEQIDELRDDLHPLGYLAWATKWANMGASLIGGCCGIGVEHIRQIGQKLK